MRKPKVKNKYGLDIAAIKRLQVGDRSDIEALAFWHNDVIGAWCISEAACPAHGLETTYWIGIYDIDAPHYAGKFRFSFETYGGMCTYRFNRFFDYREIENEWDLIIQEKFLSKINELLDNGILAVAK